MVFFNKPSGGPDNVGGVWPWTQIATMRNRSGETLVPGDVVMLAFRAGNHEATEIATNDSNSYVPGASNDTIWNTVVDWATNTITNGQAGILAGGFCGVALETIADNATGNIQWFGICEAFIVDTGGPSQDGAQPGSVLSPTLSNSLNCNVQTNGLMVGFYIDSNTTTFTSTVHGQFKRRVFLTNGLGLVANGRQTSGRVLS